MFYENFRFCSLKLETSELNDNLSIYDVERFKKPLTTLYDNIYDYLERQFHVLREDCFYHLKEAIQSLRQSKIKNIRSLTKECGLWRYDNVKFHDVFIGLFDIAYEIKFETMGKVEWADTKQMRFGSLLCLSSDNFRSYFLATVSDSNFVDLKKGLVKIHLMDSPLMSAQNRNKRFQMIETQAYYEAYVHILSRLQTFNDSSFPFTEYFLNGKVRVGTITYLLNQIPVISTKHAMDESQKKAFKTALTCSISVIQGPPGTGKTTVGFWIIEKILNRYKDKYNIQEPILVVCYTNHALDQFLEKIREICNHGDVIRIGSKSDSEKLKSSNITELINEWKSEKRFPKYMAVRRAQLREELNELKSHILDKNGYEGNQLSDAIEYERVLTEFRKCGMEEHLMVMRTAKVIGMTTTASARYANVLSDLGCKIVILEEAAEVLEAHVICSLNASCQQLIMIGDHQQLQPTAAVRDFEDVYDLNISLFERLIKNGFQHVVLTTQRRMRPEISRCILPIYPDLTDHPDVKKYDNVVGMRTNMYMFDHCYTEDGIFDTSYKNVFEVTFVKGICDYLLNEGISPEKITIVTTYRGQRHCIKQALKDDKFKEIGVFVVDAYQGEENDVIILSLVRSNFDGRIGFLKTSNRICVALSRARHGFYVVGNMTCLKSRSALWSQISVRIGPNQGCKIPVSCKRNSKHKSTIEQVEDFYNKNRCKDICGAMFPCGEHNCTDTCHAGVHDNCMTLVQKQCTRKRHLIMQPCSEKFTCHSIIISALLCGHNYEHTCNQMKLKCLETVDVVLPCSHKQNAICGTQAADLVCNQLYSQTLSCGHVVVDCVQYTGACYEEVTYRRLCNHFKIIQCFLRKIEDSLSCQVMVSVKLACSHSQLVICGTDPVNVECKKRTEQILRCGHVYIDCTVYTGLCYREKVFERPCGHKKTINCHEWVQEGKQTCKDNMNVTLLCGHEESVLCGTVASDIICSRRYSQVLLCGHTYVDCVNYSGACHTTIEKKLPCGHTKGMQCHEKDNKNECIDPCSSMLICGHICISSCVNCFSGRLHAICKVRCKDKLICGHACKDLCHSGECNGCKEDCWMMSVKHMFKGTVCVKQSVKNWIELSKSVNKRAMNPVFESIIQHLKQLKKVSDAELRNVSLAYSCYEKTANFANEVFSENDFKGDLYENIIYIESVVHRLFRWLNPCEKTLTKDCVQQFDMELARLKDMFAICLHSQNNSTGDALNDLLAEIKDSAYNCDIKDKMRRKISSRI